jgi:hypothetical protein
MTTDTDVFDAAVWAAVEGAATQADLALLKASPREHRRTLERLLAEAEARYDEAEQLRGPERDQVLDDIEAELDVLEAAYDAIAPRPPPKPQPQPKPAPKPEPQTPGEVQLQASWVSGRIVVWAAGRNTPGEDNGELADRLEGIGGPPLGWEVHNDIALPNGHKAAALAIAVREALGWLAAVGGADQDEHPGVGPSVIWIARVAVAAIRLVAQGRMVPVVKGEVRKDGRNRELHVRWMPAAVDEGEVAQLAATMPPPVTHLAKADSRVVTRDILAAVVGAIATEAAGGLQFPAPPPNTRSPAQIAEAIATRLDGSGFVAPAGPATDLTRRLDTWAKPVASQARRRIVVNLDPPDNDNAWFLSVLAATGSTLVPIEQAIVAERAATKMLDAELLRLERMLPALMRPGALRRGQVYLSQDEAWTLMTTTGEALTNAGFEVRVPALSRRKPSPSLRLFAEAGKKAAVGADQISDVRWSAVFDDVELSAAEIRRLAAEARPLVKSRGAWVELDKADLREAAAALAERADKTKLTGAEILRHAVGLVGGALGGGGIVVEGDSWATDLLAKADAAATAPVTKPRGFKGTLRAYQAEALGWLGFLDATGLGGCLALDMGLGKTPTVLAHLVARKKDGPSLVIAPAAVVGNWATEAARFVPTLKVAVHHGASRAATKKELDAELKKADVLITTYGTAVRDIEALAKRHWNVVVVDEAQAVKSHTTDTAQQLRRLDAVTKLALTGTPIENGVGDLWSILDFTNPGLVGNRPSFIASLSGEAGGEAALRALNGILVFRRTKAEPEVAAELPDRIDELDHCTMTAEQIGLYQAVLDGLVPSDGSETPKQGAILAAITALKQICNHPAAYTGDDEALHGRSGKLDRLEEIVEAVFAAGEKLLVFTHFAEWGKRLADHLCSVSGVTVDCYHGGLTRPVRDRMIAEFQSRDGAGALVLSLKAGGTGLNLTAASHVVLYDRWWNPAVEDQARDRAWRIGQTRTVVSHRLVCPGTVDERVEEVVAGKRHIADIVLPKSSSLAALDADQLRVALGLHPDTLLTDEDL